MFWICHTNPTFVAVNDEHDAGSMLCYAGSFIFTGRCKACLWALVLRWRYVHVVCCFYEISGLWWSVTCSENKMSIMEALSQDSFCHSCLEVSRKAAKTLSDPKTFQGIGTLSNEMCHVLPTELQTQVQASLLNTFDMLCWMNLSISYISL